MKFWNLLTIILLHIERSWTKVLVLPTTKTGTLQHKGFQENQWRVNVYVEIYFTSDISSTSINNVVNCWKLLRLKFEFGIDFKYCMCFEICAWNVLIWKLEPRVWTRETTEDALVIAWQSFTIGLFLFTVFNYYQQDVLKKLMNWTPLVLVHGGCPSLGSKVPFFG